MEQKFVVWVNEVDKEDLQLVGGKGANLGEMTKIGIPVPPAFIVTSQAYFYFLKVSQIEQKIKNELSFVNYQDPDSLEQVSNNVRKLILTSKIPKEISEPIIKYYEKMGSLLKPAVVAVRSSATAEDLPTASFAGQQETYLNTQGEATVLEKVRKCWSSLWLSRAIFYRHEQNFDHFKVGIAVPIQKMIQSEESGVMFTIDPLNSDKTKIIIESIYGLGELIVQGAVTPDHYELEKSTLKILSKEFSLQEKMMTKKGHGNTETSVPKNINGKQKISDEKIIELAKIAKELEKHYFFPQDIEWAIEKNKIYIVQTRPVTTIKEKNIDNKETGSEKLEVVNTKKPVLTGIGASPGIACGAVKNIKSAKEISKVKIGDILVTEMTNPDFVPAMKKVSGIITDRGGRTAHAAIVSRELGIPCVVGTLSATKTLKTGDVVTVDGEKGEVYRGGKLTPVNGNGESKLEEEIKDMNSSSQAPIKTATKIYINLAEPERASLVSKLPVDGVGLLRAEFMIAQIGTHPKKMIQDGKQKIFIDKLAEGLKVFCQAFEPRPVVYRATDFKTNEYRNLKGGEKFEPQESNPMLGFRGAYRYIESAEVFELELAAIKKVREEMNLKNLWLMIPFVRTPQELLSVKKIIASAGLSRSSSFKLWLMVEIPSNVILLDKFLETGVDGVSIGSNDLTMLIMGVDRDNEEVAKIFNERDPAVLWALEKIVKTCQHYKVTCSICGQAASDYPDLVEKLVSWGITSVSINPDAVKHTKQVIYDVENSLLKKK